MIPSKPLTAAVSIFLLRCCSTSFASAVSTDYLGAPQDVPINGIVRRVILPICAKFCPEFQDTLQENHDSFTSSMIMLYSKVAENKHDAFKLEYTTGAAEPVRLTEMQIIASLLDNPIDYTSQIAGTVLEPGASIELPGFSVDIELGVRTRYTFFTTIIGETLDGTNTCIGNSYLECVSGSNLEPVFPTNAPTQGPTATPFRTGDQNTTPCQIASSMGCNIIESNIIKPIHLAIERTDQPCDWCGVERRNLQDDNDEDGLVNLKLHFVFDDNGPTPPSSEEITDILRLASEEINGLLEEVGLNGFAFPANDNRSSKKSKSNKKKKNAKKKSKSGKKGKKGPNQDCWCFEGCCISERCMEFVPGGIRPYPC